MHALTIWQLYVVVLVNGSLTVFFDVAWQSYLPSIVARDELVEGNGKLELTRQASQRLGPGAAGVLIGALTAPIAIVLDALSYAFSALFVLWIRRVEPPPAADGTASGPRPSMRQDIAIGLRYVTRHPWLRALALCVATGNLFMTICDSILILWLVTERHFTAASIGLAFSIGSIGVILGALVTSRLTRVVGVGRMIVLAAAGESLAWLPIPLAPDALLFPALTFTIVWLGFTGVVWNVNAISLRQAITPGPMLGKMNASMRFISWGTIPLGSVLGGVLGGVLGLHNAIWVGALGTLLTFLPVALSSIRDVRVMPGEAGSATMADV